MCLAKYSHGSFNWERSCDTLLAMKCQGKSAWWFEENVCFSDKRYQYGWQLLPAAPFLPSWRKGQENNRSVSPDRHQPLKPMPATTYLQTSCCMRKINHYLLKPLRQGSPLLETKHNPNCFATTHSFIHPTFIKAYFMPVLVFRAGNLEIKGVWPLPPRSSQSSWGDRPMSGQT